MPTTAKPISIIGAGAVVKHAHLPAYKMCGFEVDCVFDLERPKAEALAAEFGIEHVADSIADLVARSTPDTIYDLAVPASAISETLLSLPDKSFVLIQKPMGENLEQAKSIRDICRKKNLNASVNFQLRYAPYALATKDAIDRGLIGEILEVDVKIHVHTPWGQWDFLEKSPRMEIVYHSIHYLDFIRYLLKEPDGVKASTIRHPASPKLHSSRSAILLDYGEQLRAQIVSYHGHDYGPRHQFSQCTIEGSTGSICFQMGLNMNYPAGEGDWLDFCTDKTLGWQRIDLEGTWFPHAFRGTMAAMMIWAEDSTKIPSTDIEDAYQTMALVEAAYQNAAEKGTPIPS